MTFVHYNLPVSRKDAAKNGTQTADTDQCNSKHERFC